MSGVLSGIKVLDLSERIAGPFCAKRLADCGAEVIKVEKPIEGDSARKLGPFPNDTPDPEKSGVFLVLNTCKKGVTLNLKTEEGKKMFLEMVKQADAVIESFKPGAMALLGMSYEALERVNPKLVMTSISNFGQKGPYRDWEATEIVWQAMGGLMRHVGEPDREPLRQGPSWAQFHAGLSAFLGTLAALYHADMTGEGQLVDISTFESIPAHSTDVQISNYSYHTDTEILQRGRTGTYVGPGLGVVACKDGYAHWEMSDFRFIKELAKIIPAPELDDAEKYGRYFFGGANLAAEDIAELEVKCIPWFLNYGIHELTDLLQSQPLPFTFVPVETMLDLLINPQLKHMGSLVEVDHPRAGRLIYHAPGARFSKCPSTLTPAPLLGQHNEEIYGERLGYTKQDLEKLREKGVI